MIANQNFDRKELIENIEMKKRNIPRRKFGIDIPETHCQQLEDLAKQRGCRRNRVVREAVEFYLQVQNANNSSVA